MWVRLPAPYSRLIFFTLICIVCLKRPKINEKEAEDAPFKNKSASGSGFEISNVHFHSHLWNCLFIIKAVNKFNLRSIEFFFLLLLRRTFVVVEKNICCCWEEHLLLAASSVIRLDNLLDYGQVFKAFGNN